MKLAKFDSNEVFSPKIKHLPDQRINLISNHSHNQKGLRE